jgi:hypothetical protein
MFLYPLVVYVPESWDCHFRLPGTLLEFGTTLSSGRVYNLSRALDRSDLLFGNAMQSNTLLELPICLWLR